MRKQAVKIFSGFMLMVFLAGIAPKEYLHELLFHHHDTAETARKKGDIVIGKKHTHCSFLSFEFGPFVAAEKQVVLFEQPGYFTNYLLPFCHCVYTNDHKVTSLRGPPACC